MTQAAEVWTPEDIREYEEAWITESRASFWMYRRYLNMNMALGWWQEEVATELQKFYARLITGERPKLILQAPPQHGKSRQLVEFVSWVAGQDPDLKTIYASFSDDLGVIANAQLQRIFESDQFRKVFPQTSVGRGYRLNSGQIEFAGHAGNFINTTVNGQVTGKELNLGVIDDPIKGRFEADSDSNRNKVWNWFTDDFFTRFAEKSGLVMILCMAGDTLVRMADGSEKPLRDVRHGDSVATYVDGGLATSKVVNWVNQGPDTTYEIKMRSGTIVRANERHPFLVTKNGVQQWVRLKDLRQGNMIVRAMSRGERGRASSVASLIAKSLSVARDVAEITMASIDGPAGSEQRRNLTRRNAETPVSSIDMELPAENMIASMPSKKVDALFVESGPIEHSTLDLAGARMFSASITAMKQKRFEPCFAMSAISLLDMDEQSNDYSRRLSTFEITHDVVESITFFGEEDVFDVQIEGTENFIANGLVSHNTRWHLDDPAGRMIEQMPDVRVLRYPAIAEQNEKHRKLGQPLFPELKSLEFLLERKAIMSQGGWESEYQQNPILVGGGMFRRHWFEIAGAAPADCQWVRRWDLAATQDDGAYTAGVLMGLSRGSKLFFVKNVVRERLDGDGVKRLIRQTAAIDMMELGKRNYQVWLPQDPGQAGKVQARDFINSLVGYDVHAELESGDKETRARPFAAQCEAGNVKLIEGPWIRNYLDELETFPAGKYADQVDASSGAFGALIMNPPKAAIAMGAARGAY